MWRKFSYFFLALSLISFFTSGFLLWQRYFNPNQLFFSSPPPPAVSSSKFQFWPESISIPSLGLNLPVFPSQITNGVWQTTAGGISYLLTSARPGEIGNSIFYGHNWPRLLGNLKNIKPGDFINIGGKTGVKTYWVTKTLIVSPRDTYILAPGTHSQLTLYTCYGFADTKRFVVIAYTQDPK